MFIKKGEAVLAFYSTNVLIMSTCFNTQLHFKEKNSGQDKIGK